MLFDRQLGCGECQRCGSGARAAVMIDIDGQLCGPARSMPWAGCPSGQSRMLWSKQPGGTIVLAPSPCKDACRAGICAATRTAPVACPFSTCFDFVPSFIQDNRKGSGTSTHHSSLVMSWKRLTCTVKRTAYERQQHTVQHSTDFKRTVAWKRTATPTCSEHPGLSIESASEDFLVGFGRMIFHMTARGIAAQNPWSNGSRE